jgi:hypothetical protein
VLHLRSTVKAVHRCCYVYCQWGRQSRNQGLVWRLLNVVAGAQQQGGWGRQLVLPRLNEVPLSSC